MKLIASNKKAFHDYEILETQEAGIELVGSEVKSLRLGKCSLKDGFVRIIKEEAWLFGMHIGLLLTTDKNYAPDEKRSRKLLLHKKEIRKLEEKVKLQGFSIVPLKIYFNAKNIAKVEIGLARGLKKHDKREVMKKKDADMKMKQAEKEYSAR